MNEDKAVYEVRARLGYLSEAEELRVRKLAAMGAGTVDEMVRDILTVRENTSRPDPFEEQMKQFQGRLFSFWEAHEILSHADWDEYRLVEEFPDVAGSLAKAHNIPELDDHRRALRDRLRARVEAKKQEHGEPYEYEDNEKWSFVDPKGEPHTAEICGRYEVALISLDEDRFTGLGWDWSGRVLKESIFVDQKEVEK